VISGVEIFTPVPWSKNGKRQIISALKPRGFGDPTFEETPFKVIPDVTLGCLQVLWLKEKLYENPKPMTSVGYN
jgi:hypothetical protein